MNKNNAFFDKQIMAQRFASLSRRHFLRGLGACMALPALESLRPLQALGSAASQGTGAASATGAPLRMAFVYFPNGSIPGEWWPNGDEKNFELNSTMQPLEKMRDQVNSFGA